MAHVLKASPSTISNLRAPAINQTLRRAFIHVLVGLSCAGTVFFLNHIAAVAVVGAVTAIFLGLELMRLRLFPTNRYISAVYSPFMRNHEETKLTGASFLLIGCLITAWIFPRDIAVIAILFLSLGDPAATVIGTWKGKRHFWGKSFEGNMACFLICLVSGAIILQLPDFSNLVVMATGILCASVLQALPLRLNDNLTIPIGSAIAMLVIRTVTA